MCDHQPPRIVFDCRYVRWDNHDGISRYTVGVVSALATLHPVEMLISDRRQLAMLPDLPWHQISAPTSVREPWVAHQIRRLGADVVFSPMQTMGSWGRRYGLVLTLHDLIYHAHPTPPPQFSAPIRLLWRLYHLAWWPQRLLLDRADEVVTVSNTTAGLIAARALSRRPVTVVPNAADAGPDGAPPRRTRALVYMGSFMAYKNVATLVRAVAELPEYELHLMSRISDRDRASLRALDPRARLVFHDGASDEVYREVLHRATALLTASRDEGFGIPLIEAMRAGTPVIASDIPVLREVGGGAVRHVAPDDVAEFVAAILELENPAVWAHRSTAGRARAEHYSWTRSAQVLLEVLQRVADTGRRNHRSVSRKSVIAAATMSGAS